MLDVDGLKERFNAKNPNTKVGHSRFSFLVEHVCAACARKEKFEAAGCLRAYETILRPCLTK